MTITFATLIFAFLFLFKGVQKNTIFLLYATAMVLTMINLFTFLAYGKDKRSAQRGEWRIPEIQLHTMELMGGTIGAIAGQKFFHHKNKKKAYMATFFATVFIQAGIIFFILHYLKIL